MRNPEVNFESHSMSGNRSPGRSLRPSSPGAKSPSNRLACAYSAFKCSSRAAEEDDHRAMAPLPPRTGAKSKEPSRQSPAKSVDSSYESDASSQLMELTGMDTIDHDPFEDPRDGDDDNDVVLTPRRTPSDDTHETPNVSNRDPAKPPSRKGLIVQALPDPNYDEFCQSNFNTPRMLHSQGSLGDQISPFDDDDESDEQDEESQLCDNYFRSALPPDQKIHLQIPTMSEPPTPSSRGSLLSETSSMSMLFGESISEEKKVADGMDHQEVTTTTLPRSLLKEPITPMVESVPRSQPQPTETSKPTSQVYRKLQHEDSSYSTVSSFVETAKDRPPFFWRSHPKVTVYSYNAHQPSRETREHPARARQPRDLDYPPEHRHSPPRKGQGGSSKMNLPSVKDRLLNIHNHNHSFGFEVTMNSLTSFATSRLATFGLGTSSS